MKYAQLAGAILALLGLAYLLVMLIAVSEFELDLDFSLEGQILRLMDIDKPRGPSLQTPMMLLAAFVVVGALIIRQFIEEHLRERDMLTPQWVDRSRMMQVILGLVAAALLAMIGVCLDLVQYTSFLPYVLSGMLMLRLTVYGVQRVLRKK